MVIKKKKEASSETSSAVAGRGFVLHSLKGGLVGGWKMMPVPHINSRSGLDMITDQVRSNLSPRP